ncbi:MAG: type I restriction enzyme HsdR N-terminal domain-containing protein, partial [Flavisolibacter sp.]|nr:type I restriction enzyme HsdR N-terminal domain-containing protein [Flavisolibacter sp.]
VRQCFLQLLVNSFHYPASLIAVEKEMILNGRKKRFDILVYSTMHQPWMLVECKAPEVEMNEKVLRQALVYHQAVPVQYIFITNGNTTLGWEKRKGHLELVWQVPEWRKS